MTDYFSEQIKANRHRPRFRAMSRLRSFIASVSRWASRRRQLQALMDLDARLLCDVRITRDQAVDEASKPFWIAFLRQ